MYTLGICNVVIDDQNVDQLRTLNSQRSTSTTSDYSLSSKVLVFTYIIGMKST